MEHGTWNITTLHFAVMFHVPCSISQHGTRNRIVNPFTRFLRSLRLGEAAPHVAGFVAQWDVVEVIVVDVHKRGHALDEELAAYAQARAFLLTNYESIWSPRFAAHWPETKEAGHPAPSDPFPRILAPTTADGFVNNWPALQALAAARETLNRYILSLQ